MALALRRNAGTQAATLTKARNPRRTGGR